jgi:hypothetical protein
MLSCWETKPSGRPSFSDLIAQIDALTEVEVSVSSTHILSLSPADEPLLQLQDLSLLGKVEPEEEQSKCDSGIMRDTA